MAQGILAPDGTAIKGIPDNIDKLGPEVEAFYKYIKQQGSDLGEGKEYTFGEGTALTRGEEEPYVTREAKLDEEAKIAEEAAPKTTVGGMAGAFARNIAPTAVAAAVSLPVAAAERLTNAITPAIADFLNDKLNLEGTPWEQMNSQEMYDFIHDKLNIQKADTPAENIAGAIGEGGAEGLGTLGAAGLAKAGGQLLQAGNPLVNPLKAKVGGLIESGGQVLADVPAKEVLGSAGATAGAKTGQEIAEATDMGPITSALMTLGGSVLGNVTASQLDDLAQATSKLMKARGMDVPEAAQEIITQANARGVDVVLSDFKPSRIEAQDARNLREVLPHGTRDVRFNTQGPKREALVSRIANEFDVDVSNPDVNKRLEGVAEDFFTKRDAEHTALKTDKYEVIDRLSEAGDSVPTPTANTLIDSEIARLEKINNPQNDPIELKLTEWRERFSDLPENPSDKTLSTIEELRSDLSQAFTGIEGGPRDRGQKVADSLYSALRKDMDDYIKNAGQPADFNKFDDAMSGLSSLMDDFDTAGISSLMNSRDTPIAAIENIILNGKPDVIRKLYPRLTPEGQNHARSAMISKMIDSSMKGENLSPNAFAAQVKNYSGQNGILFSQEDGVNLSTIKKVLDKTSRAEKEALMKDVFPGEDKPGVARLVTGIIARNPVAGLSTVLGMSATRGFAVRQLERPAMRDLLLKYDSIPAGHRYSDTKDEILKRMGEMMKGYANSAEGAIEEGYANEAEREGEQ